MKAFRPDPQLTSPQLVFDYFIIFLYWQWSGGDTYAKRSMTVDNGLRLMVEMGLIHPRLMQTCCTDLEYQVEFRQHLVATLPPLTKKARGLVRGGGKFLLYRGAGTLNDIDWKYALSSKLLELTLDGAEYAKKAEKELALTLARQAFRKVRHDSTKRFDRKTKSVRKPGEKRAEGGRAEKMERHFEGVERRGGHK